MKAWPIPVEAVRASAELVGAALLARLAVDGAIFNQQAVVELAPSGFIATVTYVLRGNLHRQHAATIPLVWAPRENVNAAG